MHRDTYFCSLLGYPSDGIVQVEEEEEENDDTDNGTYTIDADARQRRQARLLSAPQGLGARPKTSRGHRGFPQPIRPGKLFYFLCT